MVMRAALVLLFVSVFSKNALADLPDFTEIVESSSPAVVKILVEYESANPQYQQQLEEIPEYLRRFFDFRG